ncbi:hypothetical protein Lfu02_29710 [Longispora fulva]|uniref:Uncharacterized protein n=1 Tax=Longispora fulva TaxID=619741 RepID=A0A8J7GJ72_9ACTN|nr:hypothetical protein [Longispora fulva]MBG6139106.1 hypothetical protein [Longispora fulva]GIG58599.1 hypothetical protein Lfu02_29710 [Longispora fulva]
MRTLRVLTIAGLAALALAACGAEPAKSPNADTQASTSSSAPAPTPTSTVNPNPQKVPASADEVVLVRTGGLAGVKDSWKIQPDGSWTSASDRTNANKSGKLTEAQRTTLTGLLKDPVLIKELKTPGTAKCADTFNYTLVVGPETYTVENCGQPRPTFDKVLGLIQGLTS